MNYAELGLTEQEILNDLLNTENYIIENYSHGLTGATCAALRQVLFSNLHQVAEDQYQLIDEMRKKGYYQTKDAPDEDVNEAKQKYSKTLEGLQ